MKSSLYPMALVCAVCPFCVMKRIFPESAYAKKMNEIEKNCPFCNAYFKVFIEPKKKLNG